MSDLEKFIEGIVEEFKQNCKNKYPKIFVLDNSSYISYKTFNLYHDYPLENFRVEVIAKEFTIEIRCVEAKRYLTDNFEISVFKSEDILIIITNMI